MAANSCATGGISENLVASRIVVTDDFPFWIRLVSFGFTRSSTWVSCSSLLCFFLAGSSWSVCWKRYAFCFTRHTLSLVVRIGACCCACVGCSISELGCGSSVVGIGFGVGGGFGAEVGAGMDVGLRDCAISEEGEASDSYCRTGSNYLPSTCVNFDSCHSSLGTCCLALCTGCFLAGLGSFCRFSKLGVRHKTASHRVNMGFISLPPCIPLSCSWSASAVKRPQ